MLSHIAPPRRFAAHAGWAPALLPAALTLYLAFHSGGFFPAATSLAAAELAIAVAGVLVLARRPLEPPGVALVAAVAALAALAAWTLLSGSWSGSMARALPEYARALLYALALVLSGLLPFDAGRIRWMLYGLAAAIVAICTLALVARLLPHAIHDPALAEQSRLGYPLTYWNALGLMAGIGIVLCGHLACSARDAPAARVLGAASVPLLTLTLYYTLSRGSSWAAVAAVAVYLVVGRPRALLSGALATAPATLIVLAVANPTDALTGGNPFGPQAVAAGRHVAIALVACVAGAGLLRWLLLPLDRRFASFRLPAGARRPVMATAAVAALAFAVVAGAVLNVPGVVDAKYRQLTAQNDAQPGGGGSRLFSADTNGRRAHWDVALAEFRHDRLHGGGAGTYALSWEKERPNTVSVQDAHSLYLETLGELGLVGFVLLIAALVLMLGAFAYRARGPDRATFAALLAAGVGWALANAVDWHWEMPATTVWLFAFGGAALARSPRARGGLRSAGWGIAVRVTGVAVCVALAVTPARVAIAAGRYEDALDNFRNGRCGQAISDARSALSVEGQKAGPYALIAFCDMREGRFGAALDAARSAHARDPRNWETYYDLAAARAARGLDPRASAGAAASLNPNDPLASRAPAAFGGRGRREWIDAGRRAMLPPPSPDQP